MCLGTVPKRKVVASGFFITYKMCHVALGLPQACSSNTEQSEQ